MPHYTCRDVAGWCLKCVLVCVNILYIQWDEALCLHLLFPTDEIVHKHIQNLHCAKMVPLYINHVGTHLYL